MTPPSAAESVELIAAALFEFETPDCSWAEWLEYVAAHKTFAKMTERYREKAGAIVRAIASQAPPAGEPSRYHFTNDAPVMITSPQGEIQIGAGWLAITEAEYAALSPPIQEAVAGERERCARIAEEIPLVGVFTPGWPDGAVSAARQIAAAIRSTTERGGAE